MTQYKIKDAMLSMASQRRLPEEYDVTQTILSEYDQVPKMQRSGIALNRTLDTSGLISTDISEIPNHAGHLKKMLDYLGITYINHINTDKFYMPSAYYSQTVDAIADAKLFSPTLYTSLFSLSLQQLKNMPDAMMVYLIDSLEQKLFQESFIVSILNGYTPILADNTVYVNSMTHTNEQVYIGKLQTELNKMRGSIQNACILAGNMTWQAFQGHNGTSMSIGNAIELPIRYYYISSAVNVTLGTSGSGMTSLRVSSPDFAYACEFGAPIISVNPPDDNGIIKVRMDRLLNFQNLVF